MTILSVNKTRESDGRICARFLFEAGENCLIFSFQVIFMNRKARHLAHGALIAALYVALTHAQNLLLPNSATMAIQFRLSEALCILAFFTPAAIPGLSVGCLLFNLTSAGVLPLDPVVGTLATFLAALMMYLTRNIRVGKLPLLGLTMPALFNALLVGWELTVYVGNTFLLNALFVAIGELAVLLIPGTALYFGIRNRRLEHLLG